VPLPRNGITKGRHGARGGHALSKRACVAVPCPDVPHDSVKACAYTRVEVARHRAREAAAKAGALDSLEGVPVGTYVRIHVAHVPEAAAAAVAGRVQAACSGGALAPVVVTGLLQHETKLSVLNFGIRKVATFPQVVRSKDQLLFVTGLRCARAEHHHWKPMGNGLSCLACRTGCVVLDWQLCARGPQSSDAGL
jgi:40S ribosome biogenesis protein Tsr1 and BMS1 C-terminal